ncbi:hypothetical protein [Tichowtungia aerotolerans]|uniref:Uncharacterized protein n=1 Tax=Tichowtungia aerotolerans TaxID=2697043 RepID=A0A6P1MAN4_9BACT|nr:hypothetical protein [Tichowtungia aerotolerans]QHI69614.1 hypothetical protein GT409_09140 [Tichowtungia aerotolerans]
MTRRTVRKVQRMGRAVAAAFVTLFVISGISSWLIWDEYYGGIFKQKIFQAVLLGNMITSGVGALMVYLAGRR